MSNTYAHSPAVDAVDSRRIRRPRYADTRAAARREAREIATDQLAASVTR